MRKRANGRIGPPSGNHGDGQDEIPPDVAEAVRELVVRMARTTPERVTAATSLITDLGYDSVRLIELAIAAEQAFDIDRIDLDATLTIDTVADVLALVHRNLAPVR